MAKTTEIYLNRYKENLCYLMNVHVYQQRDWKTNDFCWIEFKRENPMICKGLRKGQIRKLKRTQLKNGFKLERS